MKYAIIGAMEEEVEAIQKRITIHSSKTIANCKYDLGSYGDHEIILLQSGIGKVNAALSTTILHERFKPDYVINTGSAGGTDPSLEVGDVVIGEKILHHDADATAFGYKFGQIPQMPEVFTSDDQLIQRAKDSMEELTGDFQKVVGMIGTADTFMSDADRVSQVVSRFPEVKALEMEAAAIAQVCYQYETPFLIVRSLSDIAGKTSEVSFEKFLAKAAENSASFILNML
ncbi:5'-methylthioadenosine/S-adenosylhomocysteine nucleosidase [Allobacillus sp. GCM10007491]|uniref:5'-methylthioadenosine/S-adenosylhomocysteine nucleosidase n=1 Tax=Allobacillus saliphilus TaxID=2912308 RepID=A0A941CVV7_9BACI|nr:5'-methylthioadenosine/S-adenosylhomocysteine nucleosidase [Allobacillus saliphilus]MBR7553368.1 5'-methylthioadenosine/S-adenosylhomocysteine nucleosidase [Allobacillus saliphilus]